MVLDKKSEGESIIPGALKQSKRMWAKFGTIENCSLATN